VTDRTDAELIHAAQSDAAAFAELYRRHVSTVHGWFRRRLEWAAADLTAEAFAQAWLSRRSFRDEADGSALPWLLGIARNVARESARRNEVETRARRRLGLPTDLASEGGYAAVEERLSPSVALEEALETLPAHEREALELRVVGELPYDDVAARLGLRPAAARLRVSRALRRLSALPLKEDTCLLCPPASTASAPSSRTPSAANSARGDGGVGRSGPPPCWRWSQPRRSGS
jgi:RNA polymerase sigma-70 factor (ECF subfamily)